MNAKIERVLLLGDIHANDAALTAVFNDVADRYPGRRLPVWFLGDLFGRGPQPARAYRRLLRHAPEALIVGNHEAGLIGHYASVHLGDIISGPYNAADWNVLLRQRQELCSQGLLHCDGEAISGEIYDFVSALPVICAPRPTVYLVHGGLDGPFEPPDELAPFLTRLMWDYANQPRRAQYTLDALAWVAATRPTERRIALPPNAAAPELVLVGHWHARLLYDSAGEQWHYSPRLDVTYDLGGRAMLLSPGSVGFPRQNGDRDASYAVLTLHDDRPTAVVFHTAVYDRQAVRREMARKGYPEATIKRLRLSGETDTPAPSGPPGADPSAPVESTP